MGQGGTAVVCKGAEHGVNTGEGVVVRAEAAGISRIEVVAAVGNGPLTTPARRAFSHDRVLECSRAIEVVYAAATVAVGAIGLDTVRWTLEGCGMKTLSERSSPGAADKTTVSTTVPGGGRETHALLREGKPLAQISRELDVSEQTLRNWRKQIEIDEGEREGLTTDEKEELARLRRENKVLRQEREILRKATVFFAREDGTR
jgi:transposase